MIFWVWVKCFFITERRRSRSFTVVLIWWTA